MKELMIRFNEVEVTIKQTKEGLYSLKDIEKAYRASKGSKGGFLDNWKRSEDVLKLITLREINVRSLKGVEAGTWGCEEAVMEYAMYCSNDFRRAVRRSFLELAKGNTEKALDIAASFVVTEELVTQINRQSKAVNAAIAIWDSKQSNPRGSKAYTCIWSHITAKCVTGGSLTSIKKAHGVNSLADYFIKTKHKEGIGAYLAITNMLVPLLKAGVDYYVLQDTFTSVLNQ